MPLFVCEECGCIDNTATGYYWTAKLNNKRKMFTDESKEGKALCLECMPSKWSDGSPSRGGKWHGRFPKELFDPAKHKEEHFAGTNYSDYKKILNSIKVK